MSKKPKKEKTIQQFLIPFLRKASQRWPAKIQARKNAKVIIEDGHFKNGNVRKRVMYKCHQCGVLVDQFNGHIDHLEPVVNISGFTNWEDYINRLFCSVDLLAHKCIPCHEAITREQNLERYKYKTSKKAKNEK